MTTALLTIDDLATRLGLSRRTIQTRRSRGTLGIPEINVSEIGTDTVQPRFRASDVDAFLSARTVA